jgi:hypothetical protein
VPDGTAAAPGIAFETYPSTGIYSSGANQLAVATNGSGRLFVDASGNVGVNVASPASFESGARNLVVGSGSGNNGLSIYSGTADQGIIYFADGTTTTQKYTGFIAYDHNINAMRFGTNDGNERLRITAAGLVGIGVSAPQAKLHISDLTASAVELMRLQVNLNSPSGNKSITWADSTDVVGRISVDYTAPTVKMRFGSLYNSGYQTSDLMTLTPTGLGIGTSSPGGPLEVIGTTATIAARATTEVSSKAIQIYNDGTDSYIDSTAYGAGSGGGLVFRRNGTGEMGRFDTSGRLLVGTSTSTTVSSVGYAAKAQIANSGNAGLSLHGYYNNSLYGADLIFTKSRSSTIGTNTIVQNGDDFGTIFFAGANGTGYDLGASITGQVDGTPGASSDMPGRLVFSVTADGAASPTERMRIGSTGAHQMLSDSTILSLRRSAGTSTTGALFDGRHDASMTTDGTRTIVIRVDGDVENANNSYGALSDFKLKENIVDASSQWSDLKDLRIRNYNFKPETGYGTHTQLGLIAQEVELVSPGLVSESPDCDEDGNDLGTVTKSVNYSVLYMKAVKALQEAMERIETLEAKVAALESA